MVGNPAVDGTVRLALGNTTVEEQERAPFILDLRRARAVDLRLADAGQARELAGREVRGPGWWFPSGACVSPGSLAVALLARAGGRVRRRIGRAVDRIEREGAEWRALDADGSVIAEAPTLVVANAFDAKRLLPEARLPLANVRGQVTFLPASAARHLDVVVSGSGYVAPLPDGGHVVGATYGHDDIGEDLRAADHRDNLARLARMLPSFAHGADPAALDGLTGFRCTVPDRLPVFGATTIPGVWTATGLGSRGLLWAPLGAESRAWLCLSSRICRSSRLTLSHWGGRWQAGITMGRWCLRHGSMGSGYHCRSCIPRVISCSPSRS